ncbi:hypothetical protein EYF80_035683 [Liparis tanakae]|uniref:Uncharacterized protein n=1 Tax=Liparis tanakae TaxID=230148 RepID=A0A4Z2GMV7_9TELE|nr:hypothetical protein EYF80_035683 [Liparis tanakae]
MFVHLKVTGALNVALQVQWKAIALFITQALFITRALFSTRALFRHPAAAAAATGMDEPLSAIDCR